METFLDILKYVLPSVITFLTAYFLVKKFMERDYQNQMIAMKGENQKMITPLRLQAYERLILLMERTNLSDLISRTHLARYLVERKLCKQLSDVFLRYLTPNKPGYVETSWASLTEAVSWIRQAGGQAVIAHPGRYRFNETERIALYEAFKDLGGEGLEVMTASHTRDQYAEFAKVAKEFGFLAGFNFLNTPASTRS